MALIVGNLISDPSAQSFISLDDAISYLEPEAAGGSEPLTAWMLSTPEVKEATLVTASRWLADAVSWCLPVSDVDVPQIGRAAAKLAAQAVMSSNLYAGEDARGPLKRAKAGSVEVEWTGTNKIGFGVAGKQWPWLSGMLRGLVCENNGRRVGFGFMVV